jgi:orotate phosphoribosyltransferase-like protein
MDQSQQARLDALRDAQRFLDGEATALAAANQSASRKALDDSIKEIETRGALQVQTVTDAVNGTKKKDELRAELRDHHMQLLAEIARTKLAHSPLISRFRVPHRRASDTALITAANAMVNAAEVASATFTADLGADFAAQMRARIEEFRDAVISRNYSQVLAKQTTQAVDDALVTARGIVRILNRIVLRETKDSPALRVGWQAAKHVKAKGGVPQGTVREVPVVPIVPVVPVVPTAPAAPAPELKAAA